ncbi:MAG: hypothetical protein KBT34_09840 [Prevotella sp.]|nr:hypothetical protein [Candidatus Prevotella equi]
MITPKFLDEIIEATRAAVNKMNNLFIVLIVKSICAAFKAGEDRLLTPSTIKNIGKLLKSGMNVDDVQKIIEKQMPSIKKEIRKAFMQSAKEISAHNSEIEEQMVQNARLDVKLPNTTVEGIPTNPAALNMTVHEIRVLEAAYRRTNGTVNNISNSIAPAVYEAYTQACDTAILSIQSGRSPAQAIMDAVEEATKNGIKVIEYNSGRKDSVDVAIARAVRTGVNQANSEIILTRCAELGIQYVKVSQHRGARVTHKNDFTDHSWWQGKVYSLNWNSPEISGFVHDVPADDPKFGYMQEIKTKYLQAPKEFDFPDFVKTCGYGRIEGIIGINCRHTFQAWLPEYNKITAEPIDPEDNEKRFKLEQKQRSMERAMRALRREIEAFEAIEPQTKDTKDKISERKRKLKQMGAELMQFCKENSLPYFSERIR